MLKKNLKFGLKHIGTSADGKDVIGGLWEAYQHPNIDFDSLIHAIIANGKIPDFYGFFLEAPKMYALDLVESALDFAKVPEEYKNKVLEQGKRALLKNPTIPYVTKNINYRNF